MNVVLCCAFVPRLRDGINRSRCFTALGSAAEKGVRKGYWVLFALALAVGVFIRVWRVADLPQGLYQDSAMSAAEAISLLQSGADQYGNAWPVHFEAWGHGQSSVLLAYLTIPFIHLWGVSMLTLRLPILILSLLAMPVFFDLSRRIMGKHFALLALWMLAICPWHIVQSRWGIDCNVYPHMLLFACYFLFLGIEKSPFLYLAMVFFGLSMYAYGVALYTVPFLLVLLCAYLLIHRRIRWWQAALCAVVYLVVSAPFLLVMAINYFEWETMHLGPLTLPRFYNTARAEDILFFAEQPFGQFLHNLQSFINATLLQNDGDIIHAYYASRTLYPFSIPLLIGGIYLVWRTRRDKAALALSAREQRHLDGLSLFLCWFCAAVWCGIITESSTTWRANIAYYPLLFCLCFAIWQVARRVRGLAPAAVVCYALGFVVFCSGYFHDESYIARVAHLSRHDMWGALADVHEMDCDRYYIITPEGKQKETEVMVMVAHRLDGRHLADEEVILSGDGREMDYYSFCYEYTDFVGFEPDPEECAAYVIAQEQKALFDAEEYIIHDFDLYASVYPRYWAEEEVQ